MTYWLISLISAVFTLLVVVGLPEATDSGAQVSVLRAFCLLSYSFIQASVCWHRRRGLHNARATIYLWLLGLFPLWSIPAALALFEGIRTGARFLYR